MKQKYWLALVFVTGCATAYGMTWTQHLTRTIYTGDSVTIHCGTIEDDAPAWDDDCLSLGGTPGGGC